LQAKDKSKTVGVARQQLHFLCSDKAWSFNQTGSKRKLDAALGMFYSMLSGGKYQRD
jgi:hypothetical protein